MALSVQSSCQGRFFSAKTEHNDWQLRKSAETLTLRWAPDPGPVTYLSLTTEQARELCDFLGEVLPILEKEDT
ncbi:MAG: hypothetical protein Q8R28_01670 [Dehalococcoidia bacterium]|nr:hypothetical protein [Dehalococcoidia bacterium]